MKLSPIFYISLQVLGASAFAPATPLLTNKKTLVSSGESSALCMSTIAVFGSSGLTAQECVYQALQNGDTVVGLTRSPSNVKVPQGSGGDKAGKALTDDKFISIGGDVTNPSDVAKVFDAADTIDGVVVALGGKTSDVGDTMLTDGTKNIINAMKDKGVKRLSVVTSIGAGDSEKQAPFFFKILMMTAMKKIFEDKNNQEKVVMDSDLDWCIVRPGTYKLFCFKITFLFLGIFFLIVHT